MSTMDTFASLLKTRFDDDEIANLTEAENPTLEWVPKSNKFSGDGRKVPLIDGNPQGQSAKSVAAAQAAKTSLKSAHFMLETSEYHFTVDFGAKVMAASRDNLGAFLDDQEAEVAGVYTSAGQTFEKLLWGAGGGALGQASANAAANVVALTNPEDIAWIEVGMTLRFSADGDGTAGTEALKVGSTFVTAVNREDGEFTVDDSSDITGDIDANDYIFRGEDFAGASGTEILKGIPAYITATSTPADLYGMVRTSEPQRRAGCRVPSTVVTGLSLEDRIKKLGSMMKGQFGARVGKDLWLHPEDWSDLEIMLSSRGVRPLEDESSKFGFMKLRCFAGGQSIDIRSSPGVQRGVAFLLRKENWKLHSMRELFHVVDEDGLTILRKADSDDFEQRIRSWPVLECNAPGWNGRVALED